MYQFILILHIIISVALIALILLQQGKGAITGAAFGSGASSTVFGSQGSASFLTRTTATLAALFFAFNLGLAFLTNKVSKADPLQGILEDIPIETSVPVVDPIKSPEVPKL